MRLIHAEKIELMEFYGSSVPPYAILSHTWGPGEVVLQDIASLSRTAKQGYAKIIHTCQLALSRGLKYVWIDTCCIDKSSSAELTESINSMFEWYRKSAVCLVYLYDYSFHGDVTATNLGTCRWFTRGWTLQELLAPTQMEFYNNEWSKIGAKDDLYATLAQISRIPETVIRGIEPLSVYSVAQRMSWAATRQTTRPEDRAYSLLGIFDINMSMIYGEGTNAFRRLQEEIIKRTADLSILAWKQDSRDRAICSPLAILPDAFQDSHDICKAPLFELAFSMLNKGLQLVQKRLFLYPMGDSAGQRPVRYMLEVGRTATERDYVCIPLRKIGFGTYLRESQPAILLIAPWKKASLQMTKPHNFFLEAASSSTPNSLLAALEMQEASQDAIHISSSNLAAFQYNSVIPPAAYDHANNLCYFPLGIGINFLACTFVAQVGTREVSFGVLLGSPFANGRETVPRVVLVDTTVPQGNLLFLLLMRSPHEPMGWIDIDAYLPEVAQMNSRLRVQDGKTTFVIQGSISKKLVSIEAGAMNMPSLRIEVIGES